MVFRNDENLNETVPVTPYEHASRDGNDRAAQVLAARNGTVQLNAITSLTHRKTNGVNGHAPAPPFSRPIPAPPSEPPAGTKLISLTDHELKTKYNAPLSEDIAGIFNAARLRRSRYR